MNSKYIAGFFDGEGSGMILTIRRKMKAGIIYRFRPVIKIAQKTNGVIEAINDFIGYGHIDYEKRRNGYVINGVEGVLAFVKHVIMVIKEDNNQAFVIERPEKFGGNLSYKTYKQLEKDFADKKLHPQDLKIAVAKEINKLLGPVRKKLKGKEKLIKEGYPE